MDVLAIALLIGVVAVLGWHVGWMLGSDHERDWWDPGWRDRARDRRDRERRERRRR
jgi:hypothetical protein